MPGFDDASTQNSGLALRMRADGHDVHEVSILDEIDRAYFGILFDDRTYRRGATDAVETTRADVVPEETSRLRERVRALEPDLIVARGARAALALTSALPDTQVIMVTSGFGSLTQAIEAGRVRDYLSVEKRIDRGRGLPFPVCKLDRRSARAVDLIVCESQMTRLLYTVAFPSRVGKIHPAAAWSCPALEAGARQRAQLVRPFAERDIDVLFVASSWDGLAENWRLARRIIARCGDLRVHVVGEASRPSAGARHHGRVTDRVALLGLLGRTRALVATSRFDGSGDLLCEAAAMGCNVVASKNCRNWQLCSDELVVDPYTLSTFVKRIRLAVAGSIDDRRDRLGSRGAYAELVDVFRAFT